MAFSLSFSPPLEPAPRWTGSSPYGGLSRILSAIARTVYTKKALAESP
jgi:hypothetical protein